MKYVRKWICLLLVLALVLPYLPAGAFALTIGRITTDRVGLCTTTHVNPLYPALTHSVVSSKLRTSSQTYAADSTQYLDSMQDAGDVLRAGMVAREDEIVINLQVPADQFDGTNESFNVLLENLLEAAFVHTGVPNEGDALRWVYQSCSAGAAYSYVDEVCQLDLTLYMNYYTNAQQEAALDAAVEQVLDGFGFTEETSDYEKIETVYEYICANVYYDYDNLNDTNYLLKFTAYAALINGTSVCQGYAVLLYRLLLELGIDNRVIAGIGNNDRHAWNIVALNGLYYNVDATWDATLSQNDLEYDYFLVPDAEFADHTRDAAYLTDSFYQSYPMAQQAYTGPCAAHQYQDVITEPTCTEQGYTTHTCACGDSYVDSYVDTVWHSYDDGQCTMCGCDMLRATLEDLTQYQGGVNSENGTLNTTFTNNWYTDIRIPKGAQQVRVLTFKTGGNWGSAFFNGATYISGFCDSDVGGQWITVDIPEIATIFRYGYLYDQIAQNNGLPLFQYVEFVGEELEAWESAPYMERPATGCHSFVVDVNIAPAMGDPDGYTIGTDYGYIQLPTSYTAYGEPTRLIIVCHGAGASLGTYQSDAWKTTNYSFWTDLGYAVMDMYACPQELSGSDSCLHYGNPVVLDCYKAGYDYVMENFNLKQDGIYVIGSSMGGLSSFQIVQSGLFPVLAQVAYCPVIDLFKQAYCNPWTTASYQRERIASYFGFTGTLPTFTNSKFPSAEEIALYKQNFDRTIPYSSILRNVVAGDRSTIFDVIPTSATATDAAEAALYAQLTATHPCPLIIFHNTDDSTVSYRYSQYFVDMVNRSGQEAILYTFTSGGHNAWANGESFTLQGINGEITVKESQYEAYLFFSELETHDEHYAWVDPAVEATCTENGLTEGSHCASCGDVLEAQEVVTAKGHSFGDWYVSVPSTGTTNGEQRRDCEDCDHFETGPLPLLGDVNGDGAVNTRDARLIMCYELGLIDETMLDLRVADVDGDGLVNSSDAKRIMQFELGIITQFGTCCNQQ